jgi:hypothetical protein
VGRSIPKIKKKITKEWKTENSFMCGVELSVFFFAMSEPKQKKSECVKAEVDGMRRMKA